MKQYTKFMLRTAGLLVAFSIFTAGFFYYIETKQASALVSNWQQSVTINPKNSTDFSSPTFKQSVDRAIAVGANHITLILPLYQGNVYTTDIAAGANTPTDIAIVDAVKYIHGKKLAVTFRVHLDSYDGQWRASINPGDRQTWWANYGKWIDHYARLAQANKVAQFMIGSELIHMSNPTINPTNSQGWRSLIAATRKVYSGKLTYSANWGKDGIIDEVSNIDFWDALDFIGISAYYELYTQDNQPYSIFKAWEPWNMERIKPLNTKYRKPVVFTEVGYRSVGGAHFRPWDYAGGGGYDPVEQENAYEALFAYWNQHPYMVGVHFWDWESDPAAGGQGNVSYTPQNKPAELVIKRWFGARSTATPPVAAPPTPTPAVPQYLKVKPLQRSVR